MDVSFQNQSDREGAGDLYRALTGVQNPDRDDPTVIVDLDKMAWAISWARQRELSSILGDLYRRFWKIAEFHRAGKFRGDDQEDAARIEQRVICLLFDTFNQGLHQMDLTEPAAARALAGKEGKTV